MRCLVIFAVVSALLVCGPALYWKFNKGFVGSSTRRNSMCPPCVCDCPPPVSLLGIAPGIITFPLSLSLSLDLPLAKFVFTASCESYFLFWILFLKHLMV